MFVIAIDVVAELWGRDTDAELWGRDMLIVGEIDVGSDAVVWQEKKMTSNKVSMTSYQWKEETCS